MSGAFRDDELATRARADALEERVRELEGEKHALEARLHEPPADVQGRSRGPSLVTIVLGLGAVGLLGGLLLMRALPLALLSAVSLVLVALVWGVGLRQFVTAKPGQLWVVSGGRGAVQADGRRRGYRLLWPGDRRLLVPFVEMATSMSLQPLRVEATLARVHASGGVTVQARAVAVVTLDRAHPDAAVERFVGRPESDIADVSRDVLASALRLTLATHPHDDVDALRASLIAALRDDLGRLGLVLDTLLSVEAHPTARP